MSILRRTFDSFSNFVTRLGTRADPNSASTYTLPIFAAGEIDAAYLTTWLGKVVDIKAEDATREWREWQAERKDITEIEKVEKALGVRIKVMQALKWAARDGGSAIFLGGLPGSPEMPVRWDSVGVGALKYITVMERSQVTAQDRITDPTDQNYGQPKFYSLNGADRQQRVHPSRVVRFVGIERSPNQWSDGWGDPLWYRLRDTVTNSDQIATAVAAMVNEAKVDVISVPKLMDNLATAEYEGLLIRRIDLANRVKGMMNALILDGGDSEGKGGETYETKQLSFANLHDLQDRAMMLLAGMADIPQTRLFGRAPQGMNATGDSDARNYAAAVKADQELRIQPAMRYLDEAIVRSAIGKVPEGVTWYLWRPLYDTSEAEAATIEKTYADGFKVRADTGAFQNDALAKAELNRMIESGRYPGIEDAIAETENDGVTDPDEQEAKELARMQSEAEIAAANAPKRAAANDKDAKE